MIINIVSASVNIPTHLTIYVHNTHIHTHTHMYTHTHIHTHTHTHIVDTHNVKTDTVRPLCM